LALRSPALAEQLLFGPDLHAAGWTRVTFPGIPAASFKAAGASGLEVTADAAAGLLWRALTKTSRSARTAHWRWRVNSGVPPTDLTKRGADDRVLGLYFVFGTERDTSLPPLALLRSPTVSALVYVFGGNQPRGTIISSPHMGERGKFFILRRADAIKAAWLEERVEPANDYTRAFARPPKLLIAIAVFSDSDDTRKRNSALIENLVLEE
jgi:hypothetical protein